MIIRQVAARQGRRAFASSIPQLRKRLYNTAMEIDNIQASLENSRAQLGSIESTINQTAPAGRPVSPLNSNNTQENMSAVEAFEALKRHRQTTATLGTTISDHYKPHDLLSNPPSAADVTLELLLASQAHMGHATSLWNPANQRYIFGVRQGIHIISLEVTAAHLRRAAKVITGITERGGLVLFVGTRAGHDRCVVNAAKRAGGCHLYERWIPGTITNREQILGSCRMMAVDQFDREVPEFNPQLSDRPVLKPDLVVCLNPLENYVLLQECGMNNIPTIGIVDTDVDPTWVTYPIPANDDSLRSVQVIAGVLGRAGEEGRTKRLALAEKGIMNFTPTSYLQDPDQVKAEDDKKEEEPIDVAHLIGNDD
ncbi:MAG: cell separation during budding [Chaenotheca gracillima]|nr:MAG: cell separation during budding [Chaenotheca gracillima]